MSEKIKCSILVCSDRCFSAEYEDRSGPVLKTLVEGKPLLATVFQVKIVPDEIDQIKNALIEWCDGLTKVDLILTTGGTGFSKRDVTPEATREVITKEALGIAIAMMTESLKKTPMAMLSRATAGIRGSTLIVNLPGSKKGASECLEAVINQLPHAIDLLRNSHANIEELHSKMNGAAMPSMPSIPAAKHVCPHKQKQVNFQKTVIKDNPAGRERVSPWPMMSVQEALRLVFDAVRVVDDEEIDIRQSKGRIVASTIQSKTALPPFPASIKDGYAVHSSDGPGVRKVMTAIAAGDDTKDIFVPSGYIARINTGAPIPKGADAVVQVEDTQVIKKSFDGEELEVSVIGVAPGHDIRQVGSDIEINEELLKTGVQIGPAQIGVCCTTGNAKIDVLRKIRVLIFSTGAEVVEVDRDLASGQIYDSNRHVLITSINSLGYCTAIDGGILPDNPQECLNAFNNGIQKELADVIITSGGVSMGDKDYIKDLITKDLNGTIHFGRVNMKPGKPTTFASIDNVLFFGLPGNPSSSAVTFHLFVKPALKAMTKQKPKPTIIKATIKEAITFDTRPEYHRCILEFTRDSNLPVAKSTGSQCSANINSCAKANGLIIIPSTTEEKPSFQADDIVSVMLFTDL